MENELSVLTEKDIRDSISRVTLVSDKLAESFHPTFVQNKWTWAWPSNGIPAKIDIEVTIDVLVKSLYSGNTSATVSTGRIWIRAIKDQYSKAVNLEVFLVATIESVALSQY